MENYEETLRVIAGKYGLSSILGQLDSPRMAEAMKVVFLGEFSSGKSSLINRLLGTKLPVGTKPTTKAICIIRPSGETDSSTRYFRVDDSGASQEIDWMEFDELAQSGNAFNTLAMEVPQSEILPKDAVIIDTPGEGSLSAESSITMSYLAQVDAAVFCIPACDGTLHAHARKFIANEALHRAHNRMVFAVTMSDLKPGKTKDGVPEIDIVRNRITAELKALSAEGKFIANDIDARVVCVSVSDETGDGGTSELLNALRTFVYGKSGEVAYEKHVAACRTLASSAAAILEERIDAMSLDVDGFRKKLEVVETSRQTALAKLDELTERFDEFRAMLPERIGNAFDGRVPELVYAKDPNELATATQGIAADIESAVSRLAKAKLGQQDWTIDHSFDAQIRAALPAAIERIDKTAKAISDVAFVALSGGVAAAIPGGAAAAEGAAKGAVAVAARVGAATSAAKTASTASTIKRIADKTSTVAMAAVKAAKNGNAKQGVDWAGILGKGAKILSSIMDAVNPVSYIADWKVPGVKERMLSEFRARLVARSDAMADMIWEEYDGIVLRPARQSLDERIAAVNRIRDEIESEKHDFVSDRRTMEEDIARLKAIS